MKICFLILFPEFESLLPNSVWVTCVTYSIFNNKGASKIAVSYLLVTNQKRGNFSTWRSWNMISLLYKSNGWETIQNRRKLFIRFRLQQTISLCAHLGKLMSSRTSAPVHWRELRPPAFSMEAFGHAKEFSSEHEADCFCSWTGSSVTRDKESQQPTVRQGEQYLTLCWTINSGQGKAWRPEPDWQGFTWNWGQPPKSEPYAGTEVPDASRTQGQFWAYRICHPTFVSPKWLWRSGLFSYFF